MRYIDDLDLECLEDRTKKMPAAINHDRFGSIPGNRWGAKKQCEFLLKVGHLCLRFASRESRFWGPILSSPEMLFSGQRPEMY